MSAEGDDDAWLYGDEDDKGMNLHFYFVPFMSSC